MCKKPYICGISGRPPHLKSRDETLSFLTETRHSAIMLSNQLALRHTFARTCKKFDMMYAKRAWVHWYVGEGMGGSDFSCAREDWHSI